MGTNDPLPPPPAPGQPPQPPQAPPPPPPPAPVPQFPPTEPVPAQPGVAEPPPTTQLPPTLATPAYGGSGDGGDGLPPAPGGAPPGEPPNGNSKLPWIITGVVAVVAAVIVGVVLLSSGGDDETTSTTTTAVSTTVAETTTEVSTTLEPTTTAPPTTLQITSPPTTEAPPTTAPDAEVVVVADDTGVFTVIMLDTFQTDTEPVDLNDVTFAHTSGSEDLAAYQSEDDHDTFGVTVLAAPQDQLPSAADLITQLDPGEEICTERTTESGFETLNGTAEVLLLDGCGTGGASSKVALIIPLADNPNMLIVLTQGPGPSNTDLLDFAQATIESVVML